MRSSWTVGHRPHIPCARIRTERQTRERLMPPVLKYHHAKADASRDQILLDVAVGALADLGVMFALLKMADETRGLGDSNVLALDDLRVAACAPEFLPSF